MKFSPKVKSVKQSGFWAKDRFQLIGKKLTIKRITCKPKRGIYYTPFFIKSTVNRWFDSPKHSKNDLILWKIINTL